MSETAAEIKGVYAALPTPFDERKLIQKSALDHIVDYLTHRKVAGLAVLTEAAEDPLLSPEERRTLISAVIERAAGRKPVLVNISAPATQEALELVRLAETKGAAGIVLALPRVPGIGYRELYRYVDRLARSTSVPILITARPENALRSLEPEELNMLLGHPKLAGIFIPQSPPAAFEVLAKRLRDKNPQAIVLGGCSLSQRRFARVGAQGAICGLATVASEQAAQIWNAIDGGDDRRAEELEATVAAVVDLMGPPIPEEIKDGVHRLAKRIAKRSLEGAAVQAMFPFALIKEAARLQGHPIRGDVRAPYEQAKPDLIERMRATLQRAGVLS